MFFRYFAYKNLTATQASSRKNGIPWPPPPEIRKPDGKPDGKPNI